MTTNQRLRAHKAASSYVWTQNNVNWCRMQANAATVLFSVSPNEKMGRPFILKGIIHMQLVPTLVRIPPPMTHSSDSVVLHHSSVRTGLLH
jgi:hypothetical protein